MEHLRQFSYIPVALFAIVISDLLLSNLSAASRLVNDFINSYLGIFLFLVFIISISIIQIIILNRVRRKAASLWRKELNLKQVHILVTVTQTILMILAAIIFMEIFFDNYYNPYILSTVTSISYGLNALMLSILSFKLFLWWRRRPNFIILFFFASIIAGSIAAISTIGFSFVMFQAKHHDEILPNDVPVFPPIASGSLESKLNLINYGSSIFSFIVTWVSSALLLRQYTKKLGKYVFWPLVSSPLVYFLSQFVLVFFQFTSISEQNLANLFYTFQLIFSLNSTIGGILFGVVYWIISRKLEGMSDLKTYFIVTGYGFALFFASGSATVIQTPYPPFGLLTVSLVGLSSYFMFFGLYSSIVALSKETEIRKILKKEALEQWKLFGSLSEAQMEKHISSNAMSVVKGIGDRIYEESGVQSNYSESELITEVKSILEEIKKSKQYAGQKK